jgi:DNA adenine methylase
MDLEALLEVLESLQGKFLLSSFHNTALAEYTRRNGWYTAEFRMASARTHGGGRNVRAKAEVLTANYPMSAPEKDCPA